MARTKSISISFSDNAHQDPETVSWLADCYQESEVLKYRANRERDRVREQGYKKHKISGDQAIYEARDASEKTWIILEEAMPIKLSAAMYAELDRRQDIEAKESKLRDAVRNVATVFDAPLDLLSDSFLSLVIDVDPLDAKRAYCAAISSLEESLHLDTIKGLLKKLLPFERKEEAKKEEPKQEESAPQE